MKTKGVLPNYSIGDDIYSEIDDSLYFYGKNAVVIGGNTAINVFREQLKGDMDIKIAEYIWYGGNSTYENVDKLMESPFVLSCDIIFGVGGGRAVDTAKVVADRLGKPIATFPTLASNCAASTSLSVMYNKDGTFNEYYYNSKTPVHVFIHTKIIAESPETYLWAGIGDALAKEYEVSLAVRDVRLEYNPMLGYNLSRLIGGPLLTYGDEALQDCLNNKSSDALDQAAMDIIVTAGYVSNLTVGSDYYYNSSLAHAFYYGTTILQNCSAHHTHGEIVALGTLYMLAYDGQKEILKKIYEFNKHLHLPVCLRNLNIELSEVDELVEKASEVREWTCTPYTMSKTKYRDTIIQYENVIALVSDK